MNLTNNSWNFRGRIDGTCVKFILDRIYDDLKESSQEKIHRISSQLQRAQEQHKLTVHMLEDEKFQLQNRIAHIEQEVSGKFEETDSIIQKLKKVKANHLKD